MTGADDHFLYYEDHIVEGTDYVLNIRRHRKLAGGFGFAIRSNDGMHFDIHLPQSVIPELIRMLEQVKPELSEVSGEELSP